MKNNLIIFSAAARAAEAKRNIPSFEKLFEIDAVVDSPPDIFLIIGFGPGDPYRLVGAEPSASSASAASR